MKTTLEDESVTGVAAEAPANPCPICGKATQPTGEKFGTFARRTFHFRHCPACFFSFVSDPWTDYAAIYDSRYYRGEGVDPYVDYYYELEHPEESVRRYEWNGIIAAVRSLCAVNPKTRWLDFGCGNGGQVRHVAARVGCEVGGTDTGEIVGAARAKGIRILDDEELVSWEGTCDVVTAIEVMEHLTDPLAALRRIRALLKPGGLFFYTTGNARPFRDRIPTWSYALPEIHVSFFEPESMVQALRATGFRPEFRPNLPGWEQIIRFKLCKRLGFRRCSPLHALIPWKLLVPVFQRKLEIGGLPIAWAESGAPDMRIVITGTSSGIGQYFAQRFSAQGHEVHGLARSAQRAAYPASQCDVSDWVQVERARDAVAATWPHIDALICGSAIQGAIGPAMSADPRIWSQTIRTNLDGNYFTIRAFWPLLRAAPRRGKIVCFSGGGATQARANFSAYAASKTGVVRLVENLATEWSGLSVDINAISPGAINTAMTEETVRSGPEVVGQAEYESAKRRLAEGGQSIEKAAGLIEFLLSEKSDGITGRVLAAQWDDWANLPAHLATLAPSEIYQLRRIAPEERGVKF